MIPITEKQAQRLNAQYPTINAFLDGNMEWVISEESLMNPLFADEWDWLSKITPIPFVQMTLEQAKKINI